jgi:hypothetical protein
MSEDTSALEERIERSLPVAVGMATGFSLDVAREVAAETDRPVMVLASRRQVDCEHAGGGYVGWTTPEWCSRSNRVDGRARLILTRDHGGPYQHPQDSQRQAGPQAAMAFATHSLRCDIESGVELLHIDTSIGPGGVAEDAAVAVRRAVELVEASGAIASRTRSPVCFELGVEVQGESISDPAAFASEVGPLVADFRRVRGAPPAFVVAQTGTKVRGRRNTGVVQRRGGSAAQDRQLRGLATVVRSFGSRLKAHNCDYLGDRAARRLRSAGAWMNVSPELGVAQTLAVLRAARASRLDGALDTFCEAVIEAGYWRKWADGPEEAVPDREKVLLGGSYLFSAPAFTELRDRLDRSLRSQHRSTRRIAIDAAKGVVRRFTG